MAANIRKPGLAKVPDDDFEANCTLHAALLHAEYGRPIFLLLPRYADDCACGDATCKNPGKHPIGQVPNGFKNATNAQRMARDPPWFCGAPGSKTDNARSTLGETAKILKPASFQELPLKDRIDEDRSSPLLSEVPR